MYQRLTHANNSGNAPGPCPIAPSDEISPSEEPLTPTNKLNILKCASKSTQIPAALLVTPDLQQQMRHIFAYASWPLLSAWAESMAPFIPISTCRTLSGEPMHPLKRARACKEKISEAKKAMPKSTNLYGPIPIISRLLSMPSHARISLSLSLYIYIRNVSE